MSVPENARAVPADCLTPTQVAAVGAVAGEAAETDGTYPLAEQFQLRIDAAAGAVHHLLGHLGDALVGYAQLDLTDPAGAAGAVVVAPHARRHGVGTALVEAAIRVDERLRVWAHGALPAATAFAECLGFRPVRSLWLMRRALRGSDVPELPAPWQPDGISIRPFVPGTDEAAWLHANARAFADHPEQGRITMADLLARQATPWFDPAGFFLAWRGDRLVGYHWTKAAEDGVGEVYVLGVDPDEQGTGVGKALLLRGLTHLRDEGLAAVTLYVESDNAPAVALYRKLGFEHTHTDAMYQRPQT